MASIAIVDDEIDLRNSLSELLTSNGVEVIATGKNGKDAVEICTKHSPDYLLLDLAMPEHDGFFALNELQSMKHPVKIIIITGLIDTESHSLLDKYQPYLVQLKPLNLPKLLEMIN